MSIDPEFNAWLDRSTANPVWLVEIDYVWGNYADDVWSANTETLLYASKHYYGQAGPYFYNYLDAVRDIPTFGRQLDRKTLGGAGTRSFGTLSLDNADGELDFLLDKAIDGSQVRVFLGDVTWPRSAFVPIIVAVALRANAPSTDRIEIVLSDNGALLNASIEAPVLENTINNQRVIPLIFGHCRNVSCLPEDEANVVYRVGQPGVTPLAVRDSGLDLADKLTLLLDSYIFGVGSIPDTATDEIVYGTHGLVNEDIVFVSSTGTYPTGLVEGYYFVRNKTATTFQLSNTRTGSVVDFSSNTWTGDLTVVRWNWKSNGDGTITLGHPPAGVVTADVTSATGVDFEDQETQELTAGDILDDMIENFSNVDNAGALSSWTDSDDEYDFIGCRVDDKSNLIDILSQIVTSALGFWSINLNGEFTYGRISPAALEAATPIMSFTLDDVRGQVKVSHADPLYHKLNWTYDKNWTIQNEIAAAVELQDAAYYAAKGRYASGQVRFGYDVETTPMPRNWYHKSLTESPERETLVSNIPHNPMLPDAIDSVDRWYQAYYAIYEPYLEFVDITVGLEAYALDLGDVVTFRCGSEAIADRYGMVEGTRFQVIGVTLKPLEYAVDLVLVRNRPADISDPNE